jgi:hypothetical protein
LGFQGSSACSRYFEGKCDAVPKTARQNTLDQEGHHGYTEDKREQSSQPPQLVPRPWSSNDQSEVSRPMTSNHRAKVLPMPHPLARTDRVDVYRAPLESNSLNGDHLLDVLRPFRLDREQYRAMLAVRDDLADVLSARGMDKVLQTLELRYLVRPIAHAGRTVTRQLTMLGETFLKGIDILLNVPPPPPPLEMDAVNPSITTLIETFSAATPCGNSMPQWGVSRRACAGSCDT